MAMFTLSVFERKYPFYGKFVSIIQKFLLKLKFGAYNLVHNILEHYNVLVEIRLTTSKTKRDIQYSKLGIGIVLRFAKRFKR